MQAVGVGLTALALLTGLRGEPAWSDETIEVNLRVVGHTDLGGPGPWDDAVVIGTTVVVAGAPDACAASPATLVDLKDARHPRVVATVPAPPGTAAADLAAEAVSTPAFTGDLLAVMLQPCGTGAGVRAGGVAYYDVTAPAAPRLLARSDKPGARSVSVVQRGDGRVLAATVVLGGGPASGALTVELDDLTDPAHPVSLSRWEPAAGTPSPCPADDVSIVLAAEGERALVVVSDGTVFDLDLATPAQPVLRGSVGGGPDGGRALHAAVLPVGRRTFAVVSEGNRPAEDCAAGPGGRGLRVLELPEKGAPADLTSVRLPSPAEPGRVEASGELAFVAWHGDGMRVVDLGQVRPHTVAQFVPPQADVVAVGVLPAQLVAVDRSSGLYVLERPDEGHRESLWSKIKSAAGFIGVPMVLAAAFVVPRLVSGAALATSGAPSPVPVGPRHRRA